MRREHEAAQAEAYLAQADRRIAKHRRLMLVSPNLLTARMARDLVQVLTVLRSNVKRKRRHLHRDAGRVS